MKRVLRPFLSAFSSTDLIPHPITDTAAIV
jgi:hypothetical protein